MVWRALGGPAAWTDELTLLNIIEFRLRVLAWQQTQDGQNGRNKPQQADPPPSRMKQQADRAKAERRAERYLNRQRGE